MSSYLISAIQFLVQFAPSAGRCSAVLVGGVGWRQGGVGFSWSFLSYVVLNGEGPLIHL